MMNKEVMHFYEQNILQQKMLNAGFPGFAPVTVKSRNLKAVTDLSVIATTIDRFHQIELNSLQQKYKMKFQRKVAKLYKN